MKILKSVISDLGIADFAKAVSDHKTEILSWNAHMQRVDADSKLPPIPQPMFSQFAHLPDAVAKHRAELDVWQSNVATRHVPYPKPSAHPLIDQAAKEGFDIVNDDPTPDQILSGKKRSLINSILQAEAAAISALAPAGKVRANNIRENDIVEEDKKRAETIKATDPAKFAKALEKARPASDTAHLKMQDSMRTSVDMIVRSCAQMMSDVEDLTVDNIDAWRMPEIKVTK